MDLDAILLSMCDYGVLTDDATAAELRDCGKENILRLES
jgi:hypothetical protein